MSTMADRYEGSATLLVEDGGEVELTAILATTVTGGTYSWDGRGTTHDLAALGLQGCGATLIMPDGAERPGGRAAYRDQPRHTPCSRARPRQRHGPGTNSAG